MSYCDCDYDWEPPAFCRTGSVKSARKQYRCAECNGPIFAGERYDYLTGRWEDSVETFRVCEPCLELKAGAKISVPCFCSNIVGELHDRIAEMVADLRASIPGFFFEWGRRAVKLRQRKRLLVSPTKSGGET